MEVAGYPINIVFNAVNGTAPIAKNLCVPKNHYRGEKLHNSEMYYRMNSKIIYLLFRQKVNSCRESILHVGVTLQEDSPTELQLTKIVSMPALAPLLIS